MGPPCAFAEVVGTDHVLSDPELKSSYEHDSKVHWLDAPVVTEVGAMPAVKDALARVSRGSGR
jgi:hypothetical protein